MMENTVRAPSYQERPGIHLGGYSLETLILLDNRTSKSIKRYVRLLSITLNGSIISFGRSNRYASLFEKYFILPLKLISRSRCRLILPSENYTYLLPLLKKHHTIVVCHDLHDIMNHQVPGIRKCVTKTNLKWLKHANLLVSVSEHTKDDFSKLLGKSITSRMKVLYNPLEDHWFTRVNERPGLFRAIEPFSYVLLVGSTAWYKNLDRTFQVLSAISNIKIVRVGPVKSEWKSMVGEERLLVYEDLSETHLKWLYQYALLLLFPSIHEGFGWPVLEAMVSGCPVVSSNRASLPEIGQDAVRYVDPYDVNGIKQVVINLMKNDDKRQEMIRKGKEKAKAYTMKNFKEKLIRYGEIH